MDDEENNAKNITKGTLKSFGKKVLVVVLIVVLVLGLLPMIYTIFKDDFGKISKTNSKYAYTVNSQGKVVYVRTEEDENGNEVEAEITTEDMALELKDVLEKYIDGTDEEYIEYVTYLIEAEAVTRMPYIDGLDEGELNGQIKFYRYEGKSEISGDDVKEENRLKYKKLDEFQAMVDAANQDVYNYFTIDDEGAVLIAYGSQEYKSITTGVDGGKKDADLTLDIVKETSGDQEYTGDYNSGFTSSKTMIYTKSISYSSLVSQYVMPSNLLYALLIQTRDIEFVKSIADLAYGNEVAIGIFDNKNYIQSSETYTYNKMLTMNIDTTLNFQDNLVNISDSDKNIILNSQDIAKSPYTNIPVECVLATTKIGQIRRKIIDKAER